MSKINDFLKKVILTALVPVALKEEALALYIENQQEETKQEKNQKENRPIFIPNVYSDKGVYDERRAIFETLTADGFTFKSYNIGGDKILSAKFVRELFLFKESGLKITAIKRLREFSEMELRDGKNVIESIWEMYKEPEEPEKAEETESYW